MSRQSGRSARTTQSQGGAVEGIYLRRTEIADAPGIADLLDSTTHQLFADAPLLSVIEKAILSITAVNEAGKIIGHASLTDELVIPDAPPHGWPEWVSTNLSHPGITTYNTLSLRLFVVDESVSTTVAAELLRTVFVAVPSAEFVIASFQLSGREALAGSPLSENFLQIPTKEGIDDSGWEHRVYICSRANLYPKLYIRTAEPEDFDDLTPVFNRQSRVLRERYGADEFYLAELIESQNASNKCLVAEVDGTAIGFMSISTEVDISLLRDTFDTEPFNNMQVVHQEEQPRTPPKLTDAAGSTTSLGRTGSQTSLTGSGLNKASSTRSKASKMSNVVMTHSKVRQASRVMSKGGLFDSSSRKSQANLTVSAAELAAKKAAEEAKKPKIVDVWTDSAFAVAMFCIDEEYETQTLDFMSEAFAQFPDKDFCVLTMPHTCSEISLLSQFTRVAPKPSCQLPQELYVMHRFALFEDITVSEITSDDRTGLENLLKGVENDALILADLDRHAASGTDPDGTTIGVFVAKSCDQVIGVCVFRDGKLDAARIRAHYNVEEYILFNQHASYEHAHLHHFLVNPFFSRHAKFILREAMRKWKRSCVYYRVYTAGDDTGDVQPYTLPTVLDSLVPVRRRRQIQYPMDRLMSNAPSKRIREQQTPYTLLFLNRKLMLEPKISVHPRIVVVGASDTALSFLETLCMKSHLRFSNLTLVSPYGLPKPSSAENPLLSQTCAFTSDDLKRVSFGTWVSSVADTVVGIDREDKEVALASGALLAYDYLVFAPGLQYQVPANSPQGVWAINSSEDTTAFNEWMVGSEFIGSGATVVVYGSTIDAHTAVQGLLNMDIPGEQIVFVQPVWKKGSSCFDDLHVERAVTTALSAAGVVVKTGLSLHGMGGREDASDILDFVVLRGEGIDDEEIVSVECAALLVLDEKRVSETSFQAVNESCLVFDGRLVVDNKFQTIDRCIFASGPFTKFSRRFHAEEIDPVQFSSKESGIRLAASMLPLFDPLAQPVVLGENELPSFREPKVVTGILPGRHRYLSCSKPSPFVSIDEQRTNRNHGRELVTGGNGSENTMVAVSSVRYFRVHVNQYSSVETLTTCGPEGETDIDNLICLYGLHEKYINNIVSRYDEGLISDFYSFFRETWAVAIFHDRFLEFVSEVTDGVRFNPSVDIKAFGSLARKLAELRLSEEEDDYRERSDSAMMQKALAEVDTAECSKLVKDRLVDFITYNSYHLPMYARPGMW